MFGLFKKKNGEIKVSEKVVISEAAKFQAMRSFADTHQPVTFIFWFDDSLRMAETFLSPSSGQVTLFTAREVQAHHVTGQTVVFGEHYPMRGKEQSLYGKLGLSSIVIFSSLGEPLFQRFGGDRIIRLMKQLGIKEDEVIEHKMISNSIRNAQEKIEKKVIVEQSAHSQKDWIEKNLPAG
ncbi:MAG TPA: hypothetical protein VGO58_19950 [Chitinophagaceae bacterium]|jgi:hypothetical protein|nr:hypothetical protein [Chitinophagaceae bacterium]